jgi:hypothetical protein
MFDHRGVCELSPGVSLETALRSADPCTLSDEELVDVARGWVRQAGGNDAEQARVWAEFLDRRAGSSYGARSAVRELALACTLTGRAADFRMSLSWQLADHLPQTLALLGAGGLSWSRVRVIADFGSLLDCSDPEVMARYEAYVLQDADEQTTGELREVCGRAVLMIDPKAAEKKRRRARKRRKVTLTPLADGMAELSAILPAEDARAMWEVIDRLARANAAAAKAAAKQAATDAAEQAAARAAAEAAQQAAEDAEHATAERATAARAAAQAAAEAAQAGPEFAAGPGTTEPGGAGPGGAGPGGRSEPPAGTATTTTGGMGGADPAQDAASGVNPAADPAEEAKPTEDVKPAEDAARDTGPADSDSDDAGDAGGGEATGHGGGDEAAVSWPWDHEVVDLSGPPDALDLLSPAGLALLTPPDPHSPYGGVPAPADLCGLTPVALAALAAEADLAARAVLDVLGPLADWPAPDSGTPGPAAGGPGPEPCAAAPPPAASSPTGTGGEPDAEVPGEPSGPQTAGQGTGVPGTAGQGTDTVGGSGAGAARRGDAARLLAGLIAADAAAAAGGDVDPKAAAEAAEDAEAEGYDPAPDGCSVGDGIGMDARRADAFVALVMGRAKYPGTGPVIQVTVPADTLLGVEDKPGYLAGYGPIPAHVARRLAAADDATWRRILTDPATGVVTDVGRTTYRPPAALADLIRARDMVCRDKGCRVPSARCDIDHMEPYPAGPTSERNLAGLCRSDHLIKTKFPGWSVRMDDNGTVWTTTPTGHEYGDPPHPLDPPGPAPAAPAATPTGTSSSTTSAATGRSTIADFVLGTPAGNNAATPDPDDPPPF